MAEFYIAPAAEGEGDEDVPDSVYSSSGKYIDPVRILFSFGSEVLVFKKSCAKLSFFIINNLALMLYGGWRYSPLVALYQQQPCAGNVVNVSYF